MKILSPTEIKQANESERIKDITRTEVTQKALADAQRRLNDVEAQFELALSNQRVRWAKAEEEATTKIIKLEAEIVILEKRLAEANIPIEHEKELAHNLLKEAEAKHQENEQMAETLQKRLDDLSDREEKLRIDEQNLLIRSQAIESERNQIKALSQELSIKLTKL